MLRGERGGPQLFTIPAHRAFADALAAGLIRRAASGDPLTLARALVLLPNNRAVRAVRDAFVRASGGALLLPRLVALGEPDLGEAIGTALDAADDPAPPPPAVPPLRRRMILARLVAEERAGEGRTVDAAEAVRLAGELARTLDQLLLEEVPPAALRDLDVVPELTEHWQRALSTFSIVLDRWPGELARLGMVDAVTRRARLLRRLAGRWDKVPPAGLVCAAGITDPAPAVARMLRCVAGLPRGSVVFAGLDTQMPEEEWDALGPHDPDPATGRRRRAIESHPQFHLKLLLDRIGFARGEVAIWREAGGHDAGAARGRAVANALAPAAFTGKWTALAAADRRLSGVAAAEFAAAADEAQGIALALRGALEEPGRTAALVTPDRVLARRVAAHLGRWGVEVNDTAGQPLSTLPPGTLLLALAELAAQRFAPLALLTLLKHPLVRTGEARLPWLDGVRLLDRALRGPRPPSGLEGLDAHLTGRAAAFWPEARALIAPLSGMPPRPDPAAAIACLRETAQALCGDAIWEGANGQAIAEWLTGVEAEIECGPETLELAALPALLRTLLDEVTVRQPPRRGHPRLAIYGQIEARLQTPDLMVLGGLNEGVWPGRPAPDPWLAPRVRAELGLPGLERRIGVAAHDFAQGLGAPRVLITRARREATAPALASRFWLRLQAMAGDRFERDRALEQWAQALDDAGAPVPAPRPAPSPAVRPTTISVTEVDRLKADPFAFYARRILRLVALDPVDADPTPAWRGNAVHAILEEWAREDRCDPDALPPRALAMLERAPTHPMLRALWQPRLMEATQWIAAEMARLAGEGRRVLSVEGKGSAAVAGVTLNGRYDRIDRLADGGLALVDYKTGKPPSATAVAAGYSLQLGLLGLIAERGGFEGIDGTAARFEYWSLAKRAGQFGYIDSPCDPDGKRGKIPTADFVTTAARTFEGAARRWLTGDEAFTAKLHPEYAPYAEYDQLMRLDEWYGRD